MVKHRSDRHPVVVFAIVTGLMLIVAGIDLTYGHGLAMITAGLMIAFGFWMAP